jgi:hypothetical protein
MLIFVTRVPGDAVEVMPVRASDPLFVKSSVPGEVVARLVVSAVEAFAVRVPMLALPALPLIARVFAGARMPALIVPAFPVSAFVLLGVRDPTDAVEAFPEIATVLVGVRVPALTVPTKPDKASVRLRANVPIVAVAETPVSATVTFGDAGSATIPFSLSGGLGGGCQIAI